MLQFLNSIQKFFFFLQLFLFLVSIKNIPSSLRFLFFFLIFINSPIYFSFTSLILLHLLFISLHIFMGRSACDRLSCKLLLYSHDINIDPSFMYAAPLSLFLFLFLSFSFSLSLSLSLSLYIYIYAHRYQSLFTVYIYVFPYLYSSLHI